MEEKATIHLNEEGIKAFIAKGWDIRKDQIQLKVGENGEISCDITIGGDEQITKQMIDSGLDKKLVRMDTDPNGDGTVCRIGDYWFYFGGLEAEEADPETYLKNIPKETIVDEIVTALDDLKANDMEDEYLYYYYYLMENL